MASEDDQSRSTSCFMEWMAIQEQDLAELVHSLTITENPNPMLSELIEKGMTHFEEYMKKRARLAQNDVSSFFAPAWNSSLENSLLWIAGCRPTMYIRFIYALCGSEVNTHMEEFLRGDLLSTNSLGDLTWTQMHQVDELQGRTFKEEEKLSNRLASLQEDIADAPLFSVFRGPAQMHLDRVIDDSVNRALDHHEQAMLSLLEKADELRLSTVKEVVGILTPVQAVDFLAAGKKLHLSIHELGKRRDCLHGRRT